MGKLVIFLHGLGDCGASFETFARVFPQYEWLTPTAPMMRVSLNPSKSMPAWFDLDALPVCETSWIDVAGLEVSATVVHAMLNTACKRFSSKDIFLCGFSQGGALALFAGTRFSHALGGIAAFGACSPGHLDADPSLYAAALSTPIVLLHGSRDPTVPPRLADLTEAELLNTGFRVRKVIFEGVHEVPHDIVQAALGTLENDGLSISELPFQIRDGHRL